MTLRRFPPPLRLWPTAEGLDAVVVDEFQTRAAATRAAFRAAADSGPGCGQSAALVRARPREALEDYIAHRRASEVSRMLAAAGELREQVDRVVIVGSAATLSTARAVLQACTHPYHNELSRGARGARPRYYCVNGDIDNDELHGLLELLERERPAQEPEACWGLIAIDSGDDHAPHEVLRLLRSRFNAAQADGSSASGRFVVAACEGSAFAEVAEEGWPPFSLDERLSGPWSLFTAAALLPAAVLGIDIVRLLVGGAAVSTRFGEEESDVVLELAACRQVLASQGAMRRTLTARPRALQGFCDWHNEWLVEAGPAKGLRERSAVQQLEVTSLRNRCDSIGLDTPRTSTSGTDPRALTLEMPALDEASLGQVAQALMLSTVVEADVNEFNADR